MKMIVSALCAAFLCTALPALAKEDWEQDWTVVTMATDGSWGMGTNEYVNAAIAGAIRDCKAMSARPNDCGAKLATIKKGWILGMLCGDYRILVTGDDREEVEAAARQREFDLKLHYVPDLPACKRVLIVQADGVISAERYPSGRQYKR